MEALERAAALAGLDETLNAQALVALDAVPEEVREAAGTVLWAQLDAIAEVTSAGTESTGQV